MEGIEKRLDLFQTNNMVKPLMYSYMEFHKKYTSAYVEYSSETFTEIVEDNAAYNDEATGDLYMAYPEEGLVEASGMDLRRVVEQMNELLELGIIKSFVASDESGNLIYMCFDIERLIMITDPMTQADGRLDLDYEFRDKIGFGKVTKGGAYRAMTIKELKAYALELPEPKKLIGDLIYAEEQSILFASNGAGKSVLAMQMAYAISLGKDLDLGGVTFENECEPITTVYFDYELSVPQLNQRIAIPEDDNENLFIVKQERGQIMPQNPEDLLALIKATAVANGAKCIIIDNLTKISNAADMTKATEAQRLLSPMFNMVKEEGYTIIAIHHTPKVTLEGKPFTKDHMAGSKVISDLIDALVGMVEMDSSSGENSRAYIKQLKTRNGQKVYAADNVLITEIEKGQDGMLRLANTYTGTESEAQSGVKINSAYKDTKEAAILKCIGYTYAEVGEIIGKPKSTAQDKVGKYKELYGGDYADMEGYDKEILTDMLLSIGSTVKLPKE